MLCKIINLLCDRMLLKCCHISGLAVSDKLLWTTCIHGRDHRLPMQHSFNCNIPVILIIWEIRNYQTVPVIFFYLFILHIAQKMNPCISGSKLLQPLPLRTGARNI